MRAAGWQVKKSPSTRLFSSVRQEHPPEKRGVPRSIRGGGTAGRPVTSGPVSPLRQDGKLKARSGCGMNLTKLNTPRSGARTFMAHRGHRIPVVRLPVSWQSHRSDPIIWVCTHMNSPDVTGSHARERLGFAQTK